MPDNAAAACTATTPPAAASFPRVHIAVAASAWKLLLQSGVNVYCTVGVSVNELLRDSLGLTVAQLAPVDAYILDGLPVDEPQSVIVPHTSRLALAAGLPGIAGLAMKSGSAVRGLRAGVAGQSMRERAPSDGYIVLSLYSLVLPLLAGHFLARGVSISTDQFARYARFAPDDVCTAEGVNLPAFRVAERYLGHNDRLWFSVGELCQD